MGPMERQSTHARVRTRRRCDRSQKRWRWAPISLAMLFVTVLPTDLAAASVAVEPESAEAGAVVDLTIEVVNERDAVDMTQIAIVFPDARPVRSHASLHAGWSATVDSSTGRVGSVTWSGGKLSPGASTSFLLTTTLPDDSPRLEMTVVERYSDGSIDRRDEASVPPIPALQLRGSKPSTSLAPTASSLDTSTVDTGEEAGENDRWGRLLIGVGVAIAVIIVMQSRRRARDRRESAQASSRSTSASAQVSDSSEAPHEGRRRRR